MRRVILPLVVLVALAFGAWAALAPVTVSFNVHAETEIVTGVTNGQHSASWHLRRDVLMDGCEGSKETLSGQILLNDNVHVKLVRIGDSALLGRLTTTDGHSVGELKDEIDNLIRSLNDCVELRISLEDANAEQFQRRILLPIQGQVYVGENILLGQVSPYTPLLHQGKIHLVGRRLIGEENYEAGTFPLKFGDKFVVENPVGASFALVEVFDEQPALRVIYRVQTANAKVNQFGAQPMLLKVNLWTRLKNDPVVTIPWLILVTALGMYFKIYKRTPPRDSEGDRR